MEADGRVRYASPSATRVLGLVPGTSDTEAYALVHPDDRSAARALVAGIWERASESRLLRLRGVDGA